MKTDYIVEFLNLIDILNSFQAVKPLPFKYRVRGRYSVNECKHFITDGPFCIKSLAPDILAEGVNWGNVQICALFAL
jgi:hypothetical protein